MARAPQAMPPVAPEEDPALMDPGAADVGAGDDMATEGEGAPVVVATILRNADGSYMLQPGDEPEGDDVAPTGQSFPADDTGVGQLLTAIHGLVDPDNAEGPKAVERMNEGYGGPPAAPPAV